MDTKNSDKSKKYPDEKLRGLDLLDEGKITEQVTPSKMNSSQLRKSDSLLSHNTKSQMEDKVTIYLSYASPHNKAQEDFLEALQLKLAEYGAHIEKWLDTFWDTNLALVPVQDKIAHVDGCVIVAFERLKTDSAVYRGVELDPREIYLPSVWIHMEAAMAYQAHRPILIFKDPKLVDEGMLEKGSTWWQNN